MNSNDVIIDSSVALSTTCSITAKHTVSGVRRESSCQTVLRPCVHLCLTGLDDRGSATCCRVCVKRRAEYLSCNSRSFVCVLQLSCCWPVSSLSTPKRTYLKEIAQQPRVSAASGTTIRQVTWLRLMVHSVMLQWTCKITKMVKGNCRCKQIIWTEVFLFSDFDWRTNRDLSVNWI